MITCNIVLLRCCIGGGCRYCCLSNPGPFTVFAPTNTAFDTLGPELLGCLFEDQFSGSLQAVLEYHVTTGEFLTEDLFNNQVIRMLNGEDSLIKIEADGTFVIYVFFLLVYITMPISNHRI